MKFNFEKTYPKGPFEGLSMNDWTSWTWQMKNSLKNLQDFAKIYQLSSEEVEGFNQSENLFQIRTTPYYAVLAHPSSPKDPLRLIQTPHFKEVSPGLQQMEDPLGEVQNSATKRLIHRYPDRVLFLVTDFCSVYCRFCTRKRFTGHDQSFLSKEELKNSLDYIREHKGIREVILSGGDPLTLSDAQIDMLLTEIRKIEHIEIIRVGTRMPTVNPFRITQELAKILRKHAPVFVLTHFNHPKELTYESAESLSMLVDSGVPVFNQMVLLNGINNSAVIVQALSRRLLYLRVKPYYMHHCDPSMGTDHFRTSIEDSLEIQKELWGNLSGLAMPSLSVDLPDGGGKVGYVPNFELAATEKKRTYKGFDGVISEYINPPKNNILKPEDEPYLQEWQLLLQN